MSAEEWQLVEHVEHTCVGLTTYEMPSGRRKKSYLGSIRTKIDVATDLYMKTAGGRRPNGIEVEAELALLTGRSRPPRPTSGTYRAVHAAETSMHGDPVRSYTFLEDWAEKINNAAPTDGMTHKVVLESSTCSSNVLDNDPFLQKHAEVLFPNQPEIRQFERMFIFPSFCRAAATTLPSVIYMDVCHCSGLFKSRLYIASMEDINGKILPIAYAMCQAENIDNWMWFIGLVRAGIPNWDTHFVLVTDNFSGLLRHVSEMPAPKPHHFLCAYHRQLNIDRQLSKYARDNTKIAQAYYSRLCRATTPATFGDVWRDMELDCEFDHDAKIHFTRWLRATDAAHWSVAYCDGFLFGRVTNNAAESINAMLGDNIRRRPVLGLMTGVWEAIASKYVKNRDMFESVVAPGPWLTERLNKAEYV